MSPEVYSALQFIHSQTDWEYTEQLSFVMNADGEISMSIDAQKPIARFASEQKNAIGRMTEHISEEMCVECLQIDYLYKDPFFVSLVKSYIENLFVKFGSEVSISNEMCKAFIKNDLLGDHTIICKTLDEQIELTKQNYEQYNSESCMYHLIQ